jgi:hypothetical protein
MLKRSDTVIVQWQKYVNSGKPLPIVFPDLTLLFDQIIGSQYVWNGCTSWATIADFIRVRVAEGYPIENYSRLATFWMSRKLYGQMINDPSYANKNQGVLESNALESLIDFGPMLEQYDPDDAERDPTKYNWVQEYQLEPPDKWMANEKLSWNQVYQIDCSNPDQMLEDILDALANGHDVLASMTVFKSIFNVGPNGLVLEPTANDEVAGGHQLNLTNAIPGTQRIKFPNSWGPGWGENGNGYFSYDYIKKYTTALFVIVPLTQPSPLPAPTPQPSPTPKPKPGDYLMLETDLIEHHKGVIVNGDTYVPPELWQRVGQAVQVDATHFKVNGKTYPGTIQNGTTYIHYQVMKDAGYTLTKIEPLGWTFAK